MKRLNWQELLRIAFKKPLDERQSIEFLDAVGAGGGMYDENQQRDIMSFIKKEFPNATSLVHPNFRDQFLDVTRKFSDIAPMQMLKKNG